MRNAEIEGLIGRARVIREPCDLDLLVFLARHPRAIITSEQLAAWLGYEIKQVADSLDGLIESGVLRRTLNRRHGARLFVLTKDESSNEWLSRLVSLVSTRLGRLEALDTLEALKQLSREDVALLDRPATIGKKRSHMERE